MYIENIDASISSLVDTTSISQAFDSSIGQGFGIYRPSFNDLFQRAITGELDLSFGGIFRNIFQIIFAELISHIGLMQQVIFVAIIAALLKVLTDSFATKSVGEMGFYVCYIALITIIFTSFRVALVTTTNMINAVADFVLISIPVVISMVFMSGQATGAVAYNGMFLFGIWAVKTLLMPVLLTFISFLTTIHVVNYLTENEILKNLSKMLGDFVKKGIKWFAALFLFILGLQRISTPILNNLAVRGVRLTINAVPVVGGALAGAVDSIFYLAQAGKNGVIIAIVIALIYIGMVPMIKLFTMMFTYKIVAAIIQPIADKRIIKCLDTVGSCIGLLLSVSGIVVMMFSLALVLLVSVA